MSKPIAHAVPKEGLPLLAPAMAPVTFVGKPPFNLYPVDLLAPAGTLGITVSVLNGDISIKNIDDASSLMGKVAVGDRITHVNQKEVVGMNITEFQNVLKEGGETRMMKILRPSPTQFYNTSMNQRYQYCTTSELNKIASLEVQGKPTTSSIVYKHNRPLSRQTNQHSVSLSASLPLRRNKSNTNKIPDSDNHHMSSYPAVDLLFTGKKDRRFFWIISALATAGQERLFQGKWLDIDSWAKIIQKNYILPHVRYQFSTDDLDSAIQSNKQLKDQMSLMVNSCGLFIRFFGKNSKRVVLIAASPLQTQQHVTTNCLHDESDSKDKSKNNASASRSRRSNRMFARCPPTDKIPDDGIPDFDTLKLEEKQAIPHHFLKRVMETVEKKAKQKPSAQQLLDPLCDALRNGPKLPEGASIYWDSNEARKWTRALEKETSLEAINRRIQVLQKALASHVSYKEIIDLQDGVQLTQQQVFELYQRIMRMIKLYQIMLEKIPNWNLTKCIDHAAKNELKEFFVDSVISVKKLKTWHHEFFSCGKFKYFPPKLKKSRKRKNNASGSET